MNRWKESLERSWWQPKPTGWTLALRPLEWLYAHLAEAQRQKWRASREVDPRVPTVVVGNWVVGGAGKTPTTLALIDHLRRRGWTPGIVSRGYGRHRDEVQWVDPNDLQVDNYGDEPCLLALRSRVPVCVGRDRARARDFLLQQHPQVDIVVSDDGLQHHRLSRTVEVVVVDERGAGNEHLLPAGPLRERPPKTLGPRQLLVYSAGMPSLPLPGHDAERSVSSIVLLDDWRRGQAGHPLAEWLSDPLRTSSESRAYAVAGIAVPQRFFDTLEALGLRAQALPQADHQAYCEPPWPDDATDIYTTEKDAIKLSAFTRPGLRIWVLPLDFRLPTAFLRALDALLPPPPTA